MSEAFIGEIRLFPLSYAPQSWLPCNGQILAIAQYSALFAILGVAYGGDGASTFALPNLQGKVGIGAGSTVALGAVGGELAHVLTVNEMPAHTHYANANQSEATVADPTNNVWAASDTIKPYGTTASTTMSSSAIGSVGSNQPHTNLQPYTVVNFCICINGIFPSRN